MNHTVLALAAGAILVVVGGSSVHSTLGLRNHNPMNIVSNPVNKWKGQVGVNGRFCVFKTSFYGLRAGSRLLRNYITKYHLTSVHGLINRYAPTIENDTSEYSRFVASKLQIDEFSHVLGESDLTGLVKAIVTFENGFNPFSDRIIRSAVSESIR